MSNVMVEIKLGNRSQDDVLALLRSLGAEPVPHLAPVRMKEGTVVVTVSVPREAMCDRIRKLDGVVEAYSSPEIAPFDMAP